MDFLKLYQYYENKLYVENQSLEFELKEIFKSIHDKIVYFYFSISMNQKDARKSLRYINKRQKIEQDKNFSFAILNCQEKLDMLNTYEVINLGLEEVFYAYKRKTDVSYYPALVLETLVEVAIDAFVLDINEDVKLEKTPSFKKEILEEYQRKKYQVYALLEFTKKMLSLYNEFEYNAFYKRILQK